ncbi:unnamed protein product [Allacma fusca]|uniref:C2 domain-containing protein n=1 Tax=Allacma fusca TaxID=39272 RepID=A0A8J2LDP8_9HEXA|nr:unnamed protein product [Allacma fusca]
MWRKVYVIDNPCDSRDLLGGDIISGGDSGSDAVLLPSQSQLVVHRRSDTSTTLNTTKSQHLVMSMKKSPSPPMHYTSPKNLSPATPPSEESAGSPLGSRFSTTAEIHQKIQRSSQLISNSLSLQAHPQQKFRDKSPSPRSSPQISPSSECNEVMNQRNGNSAPDPNPPTSSNANPPPQVTTPIVLTGGGANLLGVLHFRVRYKTEKGALIVTVVKCEDLPVKDTTLMTCDPYVKLQLLPEKQQRVKTRVLRHTRQPLYEEDFTFYGIQPNQLQGMTLHFVVLSFDRYSRDDVIGEVFCPLSGVELPQTDNHHLEISRDIQPRNLKVRDN